MNRRQRFALLLGPLPLRLVLGVTMLWAGLGKVLITTPYAPEQAAVLGNMGMDLDKEATPRADNMGFGSDLTNDPETGLPVVTPRAPGVYRAEDFAQPVERARVYGLVLLMRGAAYPAPDALDAEGKPATGFWPEALGRAPGAFVLAWMAALGEIACGLACLLGLLTRLGALGVASIMAVAAWLTELGPAIQKGVTTLFFLPGYDAGATDLWTRPLWQFAILCAALTLALLGPGALSFDRLMFGPKGEPNGGDEDDEEWDEDDEG